MPELEKKNPTENVFLFQLWPIGRISKIFLRRAKQQASHLSFATVIGCPLTHCFETLPLSSRMIKCLLLLFLILQFLSTPATALQQGVVLLPCHFGEASMQTSIILGCAFLFLLLSLKR